MVVVWVLFLGGSQRAKARLATHIKPFFISGFASCKLDRIEVTFAGPGHKTNCRHLKGWLLMGRDEYLGLGIPMHMASPTIRYNHNLKEPHLESQILQRWGSLIWVGSYIGYIWRVVPYYWSDMTNLFSINTFSTCACADARLGTVIHPH